MYMYACSVDSHTPTVTKPRGFGLGNINDLHLVFIISRNLGMVTKSGDFCAMLSDDTKCPPTLSCHRSCMCFSRALLSDQSTHGDW